MAPLVPLQTFGLGFFLVILLTVGGVVALWVWVTYRMRRPSAGQRMGASERVEDHTLDQADREERIDDETR